MHRPSSHTLRFLYVIDRIRQQIAILDRKTLEILGYFGDGVGPAPGQFYVLHDIAADSKGNVYSAEVNEREQTSPEVRVQGDVADADKMKMSSTPAR